MEKPIVWLGQSRKDLAAMSEDVKDEVGYALDQVQRGMTPFHATPMRGTLREVMEIHVDEGGDTYRAMYTVKLEGIVYVLDVFKKKSKRGRETPREDIKRLESRLRVARLHYQSLEEDED